MSESFSKSQRILKSRDFKEVLDNGQKIVSRNCVLFFKTKKEESSRLGLIVSRKVGKAVQRNGVKRIVREWFRKNPVDGFDVVVLARHRASSAQTHQLTSELDYCYGKARKVARSRIQN